MNTQGWLAADLPINKRNPLNANGAFVQLRNGDILFAYNRILARENDGFGAEISGVCSHDGGISWSSPAVIIATDAQDTQGDISNLSFLRLADNKLAMFYTALRKPDDLRLYLRVSLDEGHTWSAESACMAYPGYFSVINDRVARLSSGRIIIPAAYHDQLPEGERAPGMTGERVFTSINFSGTCHFFYSDDDGRTWNIAPGMAASNVQCSFTGLQEPGIVELASGVIWGFARTDLGRHYEFFSFDKGLTWTQAQPSRFTGPCSPMAIKRAPGGSLVAVWNPVPTYLSQEYDQPRPLRSRLVYAISWDEGASWQEEALVEDDSTGDFTHPSVFFARDAMLLSYNATMGNEVKNGAIRIRRIPI